MSRLGKRRGLFDTGDDKEGKGRQFEQNKPFISPEKEKRRARGMLSFFFFLFFFFFLLGVTS